MIHQEFVYAEAFPKSKRTATMSQFTESEIRRELQNATVEPLLPIEKKLIGWSLGLGVGLLVILAVLNQIFPVSP
jgi:hypothetical protein